MSHIMESLPLTTSWILIKIPQRYNYLIFGCLNHFVESFIHNEDYFVFHHFLNQGIFIINHFDGCNICLLNKLLHFNNTRKKLKDFLLAS